MNQLNKVWPESRVLTPPVNPNLLNLKSDVMGFLNEAMILYPEALSLASGRPSADYFDIKASIRKFDSYVRYCMSTGRSTEEEVLSDLGQYNKASGIINEIIVKYLAKDEKIEADPADTIITVGAQEAMALVLNALCHPDHHRIAIENPSYIGMSAYARISGFDCIPVSTTAANGLDVVELEKKVQEARRSSKPVRLFYTIPDHQNPTGILMSIKKRIALLKLADKYDFYILEDNAYGSFTYEGEKIPSMKSIDINDRVIYVGSFSKTLFPSLRLAVLVAGQQFRHEGKTISLSDKIAVLKGYLSLNTPSITQAILGGYLVDSGFSLEETVKAKVQGCYKRREAICQALQEHLGDYEELLSWNTPKGGFFLNLNLPFRLNENSVMECAKKFGVIFCPMSFFYYEGRGGENQMRLAFSNLSTEEIRLAVQRLCNYIKSKIN